MFYSCGHVYCLASDGPADSEEEAMIVTLQETTNEVIYGRELVRQVTNTYKGYEQEHFIVLYLLLS